jgi:hypothetical protein
LTNGLVKRATGKPTSVESDYYWRARLRTRDSARSRGSRVVSAHGLNTQRMSAVQKVWSSYVYATILLQHGPTAKDLEEDLETKLGNGHRHADPQTSVEMAELHVDLHPSFHEKTNATTTFGGTEQAFVLFRACCSLASFLQLEGSRQVERYAAWYNRKIGVKDAKAQNIC